MSRPYLIKLIAKGDIPHSMVGRHRRLKAEDVFAYMAQRDETRAKAMDQLLAGGADLY
jgi:excisionase family DNA binding protein